jgi:hypothetical protein
MEWTICSVAGFSEAPAVGPRRSSHNPNEDRAMAAKKKKKAKKAKK